MNKRRGSFLVVEEDEVDESVTDKPEWDEKELNYVKCAA